MPYNRADTIKEIVHHMAKAFFASAWAEARDEAGQGAADEIMDVVPAEIDIAAYYAARTLCADMMRVNGKALTVLFDELCEACKGEGDRPHTPEYFGHYAAMQAMGHGVGLDDAFGRKARDIVRVPYVEFGSHSLSKDYF